MFTHNNLVNAQGDVFPNAIVLIASMKSIEDTVTRRCKTFELRGNDQFDVKIEEDEDRGPLELIEYTVHYYSDGNKRAQGRLPYTLNDKTGATTFKFELTEKLAEMYDRANGGEAQKMVYICEHHLKTVVLESLK